MLELPWWDIPVLIALGLFAGGLAGLLGIGGGLIFAPLLLLLGLPPHQALATSSFAIVPTALSGAVTHLRSGTIPQRSGLAIGLAAFGAALLFGGLAGSVSGWLLVALQTVIYVVLAFAVRVREEEEASLDGCERGSTVRNRTGARRKKKKRKKDDESSSSLYGAIV